MIDEIAWKWRFALGESSKMTIPRKVLNPTTGINWVVDKTISTRLLLRYLSSNFLASHFSPRWGHTRSRMWNSRVEHIWLPRICQDERRSPQSCYIRKWSYLPRNVLTTHYIVLLRSSTMANGIFICYLCDTRTTLDEEAKPHLLHMQTVT
jgi:hypothetical protein